jgi:hypothetical protein
MIAMDVHDSNAQAFMCVCIVYHHKNILQRFSFAMLSGMHRRAFELLT